MGAIRGDTEQPFARPVNRVPTGAHWTDSFSHGELLRAGHDERLEVDPANLRFLFQGVGDEARKGKSYGRKIPWHLGILEPVPPAEELKPVGRLDDFFITPADVKRRLERPAGERRLAFANHEGTFEQWRQRCKEKLTELLNITRPDRALSGMSGKPAFRACGSRLW